MSARQRVLSAVMVASAVAAVVLGIGAASAGAFGTLGYQGKEHHWITKSALGCWPEGKLSDNTCFEPKTLAALAGKDGWWLLGGAVENPDDTWGLINTPEQHCDDADYLAPKYYDWHTYPTGGRGFGPRSGADDEFIKCLKYLRSQFDHARDLAGRMLNPNGSVDESAADLDCHFLSNNTDSGGSIKCDILLALGRVLHGTEDYYSHSNWTDSVDPSPDYLHGYGVANPPGLGHLAPSPMLAMNSTKVPWFPPDFTTGCFYGGSKLGFPHSFACKDRVSHEDLNKDYGYMAVNTQTGDLTADCRHSFLSENCSARSRQNGNFGRAAKVARADAIAQFAALRAAINQKYDANDAYLRIECILTHDDPMKSCDFPRKFTVHYTGCNTSGPWLGQQCARNIVIPSGSTLDRQTLKRPTCSPPPDKEQELCSYFGEAVSGTLTGTTPPSVAGPYGPGTCSEPATDAPSAISFDLKGDRSVPGADNAGNGLVVAFSTLVRVPPAICWGDPNNYPVGVGVVFAYLRAAQWIPGADSTPWALTDDVGNSANPITVDFIY